MSTSNEHRTPFPDLDCIHWLDADEPEELSPLSEGTDTISESHPNAEEA